jgi:magnesium-transporting ATPase (P-type)
MTGDVNDAPALKSANMGLLWELMGQPSKEGPTWYDDNFLPF